jgi:hypothetical protein
VTKSGTPSHDEADGTEWDLFGARKQISGGILTVLSDAWVR